MRMATAATRRRRCQDYDLLGCRIVGVGNTMEDIIAYKACGLEDYNTNRVELGFMYRIKCY